MSDWSPHADHNLAGIYSAIVTQNDDLDGPGGRVRVRFPWMKHGDIDQSYWAAVATPMVGEDFGAYFMPEVDDEVCVMFISGQIDMPVVVGGAWSDVDPPPECNEDGKNDFRLIKSRSGHRLLFDDSDETKLVVSDCKDENLVALGKHAEGGSSAQNSYETPVPFGIEGESTEGVSIAAMTGTLNVWCPAGTLTVRAKTVELTGASSVDAKAGANFTGLATSRINIGGAGSSGFEGSITKIGRG